MTVRNREHSLREEVLQSVVDKLKQYGSRGLDVSVLTTMASEDTIATMLKESTADQLVGLRLIEVVQRNKLHLRCTA
jgi:hypothetical protein